MRPRVSEAERWRVRPTETATIASALFLLATAALASDPSVQWGLLVTFGLAAGYTLLWYHLLPATAFGEARYAVAGSVVQAILVFMLVATGGVASPWFVFYLLPVLATVFSYRPRSTAIVAAVGMAGIAFVTLGGADVGDATTREVFVVRLIGFAALATMAYTLTRTMRAHRRALQSQEDRLRELLAAAERDAMTDPLTGVHNRRALDQALARASSRAERLGAPYSVLLIDVDQLKAINDRAGHAAGDEALRVVASAASEAIRGYDIVARAGGDEFVVMLHDTQGGGVERTRARIAQRAVDRLGAQTALAGATISIGSATWRAGRSPAQLLAEADERMYEAKRAQRARD